MAVFTPFGSESKFPTHHIMAEVKRLTAFESPIARRHEGLVQLIMIEIIDHSTLHQNGRVVYDTASESVLGF